MSMQLELSDKFKSELQQSLKQMYRETLEEAKRDAGISKEYFSIPEAMEYLNISRNTLMNNFVARGLPLYRIENKQFIKKSEIHKFIEAHQI